MGRNFAGNVGTGGKPFNGDHLSVCDDPLLTDKEVCVILNCARSTLWRWAAEGTIPKPFKIGGLARWRMSTICAVIDRAETEAQAT